MISPLRSVGPATLRRLCWLGAVASLVGAWIARGAAIFREATDPTVPQLSDFYQYTFAHYEPLALYASAALFALLALILKRDAAVSLPSTAFFLNKKLPLVVALIVLLAACLGRFLVDANFDLCIDECLNDFEAKILAQHHLVAPVPDEWRGYAEALKVPYQNYNAVHGYWASGFLPGFASLDFLARAAHLDWALSPLLGATSICLLAALARRLFPATPLLAANLAVLLLAVSPQFLAMAMTKFAWTAQLAGMLLWLWLFTHPNRRLFLLTPILGAALIGLHQPHVHPLLAAPFVLRLAWNRQWPIFAWFSAWYLAGAAVWYPVFALLRPAALGAGGDLHNFLLPGTSAFVPVVLSILFAIFHSVTLLGWGTPALFALMGVCVLTWKTQPVIVRDGLAAAALTFLFYLTFPHPQGHGWGFRYLHGAYGLLVLAATAGGVTLWQHGLQSQVMRAVALSAVFSLCVQIPYRAYEISALVRPLARASHFIATRPTDFVIVETSDFWYSWDLIRNDPWLRERPLIFNGARLSINQRTELYRRGSVTVVGAEQVRPFGVILSDPAKQAP